MEEQELMEPGGEHQIPPMKYCYDFLYFFFFLFFPSPLVKEETHDSFNIAIMFVTILFNTKEFLSFCGTCSWWVYLYYKKICFSPVYQWSALSPSSFFFTYFSVNFFEMAEALRETDELRS